MKLKEMLEKRANLVHQAREILNTADKEERGLNQEEESKYNKIDTDIDSLTKRIDQEKRMSEIEGQMEQRLNDPIKPKGGKEDKEKRNLHPRAVEEYREAFWKALRSGQNTLNGEQNSLLQNNEIRAMAIGTDANGGYVVPDEFERQLVKLIEEQNVMRGLATVIQTGSGSREIPVEADYGTAEWLGEASAYTESDATFANKVLSAYKLGTIIKVSEELMNDSFFDMESYVSSAFARRFARAEETAFINGDGNSKPTGVVQSAQAAVSAAAGQTASITADDLIDLFYGLRRVYRNNGTFLLADSTAKAIRKLTDSNGQYLWQPSLSAAQPDRILNRPVVVSDDVPEMAASAKSILFGDFKHYWIADRQGRTMQRLNELYAGNGQVGFRMYQRVDGKLIRDDAVVAYQNSAT